MEKEKNHLIQVNTQLQEDLVKSTDTFKKEKDLMEEEIKLRIENLEKSNSRYAEVIQIL